MGIAKKEPAARRLHITETPMTISNWYQHVNWLNVTFIVFFPLAGLVAAYFYPANLYTLIFAVVYYYNSGLGITAGSSLPWQYIAIHRFTTSSRY